MKKFWNSVKKFVKKQFGANTLEVIMILALAGIAGVGIYTLGKTIFGWSDQKVTEITESKDYQETNN